MTDPLDDATYLALCVWDEARGEPDDGKAAVARVVLNRARLHYADASGTIAGAVLCHDQFSGFWFDMVDGHYRQVCFSAADAQAKAANLLKLAEQNPAVWADCAHVADLVRQGLYVGGPRYSDMTDAAVLYYNPAVVKTHPAWALPSRFICGIGNHDFYSDPR